VGGSDSPTVSKIAMSTETDEVLQRVRSVADEEFGPFPVQSAADALTAIENGLFDRRVENLKLQRTLDKIRKAFPGPGIDFSPFHVLAEIKRIVTGE
jgi:hypothetical protein